jgi:hypothetical protein
MDSSKYFWDVRLASFLNLTPERAVISAKAGRTGWVANRRRAAKALSRNDRRLK